MNPTMMVAPPSRATAPRVVPTVLTLGEPAAREIGALLTMIWRAGGAGAAFGSSEVEAEALMSDAEVEAIVLKLSPALLELSTPPINPSQLLVVGAAPAEGDAALLRAISLLGPSGRLVLNADDPQLVAFARGRSWPIAWYSTDPTCPEVMRGVGDSGDGALVVEGHLMIAHEGAWCDAGQVRRLPPHLAPSTALAAGLAALCAGVSLRTVVAALPA